MRTIFGGNMQSAAKAAVVVSLLAFLVLGAVTPALAQDQLNLNDGTTNFFFNGAGTTHISLTIPAFSCSGGNCYLAQSTASGTGNLQSSGTYAIWSTSNSPFYLTVGAGGNSTVTQTSQIQFSYNSTGGTLTGLLNLDSISATNNGHSTVLGTLQVTGGTFAQYFPNGGNVNITLGVTFPLQILWKVHGFATAEVASGTIVPATACGSLLELKRNQTGAWRNETGLPRVYANDLNAFFTQTNNPTQIPCSGSEPCGSIDVALGTGSFSGDLVVTVQLGGTGEGLQFDRMGFNSDIQSGLFLDCFNFSSSCTSGVGGATLGGAKQEDGFGSFQNTLYTGLNGGSGCSPDGTGCKNLFTFVIGDSNGPLQLSDFNSYVAGHVANGVCSGFIATPSN
jgi:hypothetical protein